ncbi:MAG: hypothetical protein QOH70_253 [Blastocatellia bacterium]|jgi:hypothetical protein|nr:hypothetical protein [Blastocatellia bacterium]
MAIRSGKASQRREELRKQFWPEDDAWTGENEKGWFMAARTLPLILALLGEKAISGTLDPTKVYVDLLARHIDGGVVEMVHEGEHAYAAGYVGTRGIRTWQERMKILEKTGFIKTKRIGNHGKYVLLVHPTSAVQKLRDAGKVSDQWWDAYRERQIQTKEMSYNDRMSLSDNVIDLEAARAATKAS